MIYFYNYSPPGRIFSVWWKVPVSFRTGDPTEPDIFPRSLPLRVFGRQSDRNPDTQHKIKENSFIGASYGYKLYINFK